MSLAVSVLKCYIYHTSNLCRLTKTKDRDGFVKTLRQIEKIAPFYKKPIGYVHKEFSIEQANFEFNSCKNTESDRVVYYLHGGSYISKLCAAHRLKTKPFSLAGDKANVLFVDYRTFPECTYPSATDEVMLGWNWLIENGYKPEKIIIAGESAGGHLVINLLMRLRDAGMALPKAAVCMSPWLDVTCGGESYRTNFNKDPVVGWKKGEFDDEYKAWFMKSPFFGYFGNCDKTDKYVSPVFADCSGFCPIYISVGGNEMLLSDSVTLAENMKKANVRCVLDVEKGMFHGFMIYPVLRVSLKAFKRITNFISEEFNA